MSVSDWTPEQVVAWLEGLPLPIGQDVLSAFATCRIDGGLLLQLDHARLTDLKLSALGHREQILGCISRLSTMFRDHHSDRCYSLTRDVVDQSGMVAAFLSRLHEADTPRKYGSNSNGDHAEDSNLSTVLCDLFRSTRTLAVWLDRNGVQDFTKDYQEFRPILLRCVLFLATKFKDADTSHFELVQKCKMLATMATSVRECLDATDLGHVRPVTANVSLAPAESNPKGWGFSVKPSQGAIFINSILSDTPASQCGDLRSGDELIEIDGLAVCGWAIESVTSRLRQASKSEPLLLSVLRGLVPSAPGSSSDGKSGRKPLFVLLPESLDGTDISISSPLDFGHLGASPLGSLAGTESRTSQESSPSSSSKLANSPAQAQQNGKVHSGSPALVASRKQRGRAVNEDNGGEGSSAGSSGSEAESRAAAGQEQQPVANGSKPVGKGGGVKACQSDSSVPRAAKPHQALTKAQSMSTAGSEMEFGYRTQIVGGVVMRIPVQASDSGKSKQSKKASKSSWFFRKGSLDTAPVYKGFGSGDIKPSTVAEESPHDVQIEDSVRPGFGNSASRSPMAADGMEGGRRQKSMTQGSMTLSSLSRKFDRETNVGDCNVPVSSLGDPECQGWMTKQGNVNKNWKRRWFVLKGLCLYYFRTPNDDRALNVIPLPSYRVEMATDVKKAFALRLGHKNARTFLMYCETFEEVMMWITALKTATEGSTAAAEGALPDASGSVFHTIASQDSDLTESSVL